MSPLEPVAEWQEEARALRRFGMALARDNRWPADERSTAALVETLISRALAARHVDDGPRELGPRSRLLALFVRLHRRHIRLRRIQDDGDEAGGERLPADRMAVSESAVERAIRIMPFELREALLLVALERLSHVEAAAALEIPLAALIERLERARTVLALHMNRSDSRPSSSPPHLRVVK